MCWTIWFIAAVPAMRSLNEARAAQQEMLNRLSQLEQQIKMLQTNINASRLEDE